MHTNNAFYEIYGILGKCGAHKVFLGFAPAKLLYAVSFADTLNEDTGVGYQRPRDRSHSLDFKRYINQPQSSTIPLTFNLRSELSRNWKIEGSESRVVLKLRIGNQCMAQVDCQHRLGELIESEVSLAFMTFVGLDLRSEMAMFTVINSKAKGLSSSLTDFHTSNLIEDLAAQAPHLFLARRLNEDPQSPWFKLIRCGGQSTSGLRRRTSLRMMQHSIRHFLVQTRCHEKMGIESVAQLLIAYWRAVATVFRTEWLNHRGNLITKGVGLYGLTHLLSTIIIVRDGQCHSQESFEELLRPLKDRIDWGGNGTFSSAGGRKGASDVHSFLRESLGI